MSKKINYNDLMADINFLLKQYENILKISDSVMNDVKEYLANGDYTDLHREELLEFLINDESGQQLVRLALLLSYVSDPQNKEVVAAFADNVVNNNIDDIKSISDILNLFNFTKMVANLINMAVLDFGDVLNEGNNACKPVFDGKFDDDFDEYLDDDFDDEEDYEYTPTPKKRILH